MLYSPQHGPYFMISCRRVNIVGPVNREFYIAQVCLAQNPIPMTYPILDFFQQIYLYFTLTAAIVA